tara:strand:- start:1144 stop:1464 length:321 start_codon:yes stop_codon:yes gene_type:complete
MIYDPTTAKTVQNSIPQFESYEEELEFRFEKIAEAIKALANKTKMLESFLGRGAEMIQYRIPGREDYSDLKEVFDDLYLRLNTLETNNTINASVSDRDGKELRESS